MCDFQRMINNARVRFNFDSKIAIIIAVIIVVVYVALVIALSQ